MVPIAVYGVEWTSISVSSSFNGSAMANSERRLQIPVPRSLNVYTSGSQLTQYVLLTLKETIIKFSYTYYSYFNQLRNYQYPYFLS